MKYLWIILCQITFSYGAINTDDFKATEDGKISGILICEQLRASTLGKYMQENLISSKGKLLADDSINRIYIEDFPENIVNCLKYFKAKDIAPKSYIIECTVIELDLDRNKEVQIAIEAWKDVANNPQATSVDEGIYLSGMNAEPLYEFVKELVLNGQAKSVESQSVKAFLDESVLLSFSDLGDESKSKMVFFLNLTGCKNNYHLDIKANIKNEIKLSGKIKKQISQNERMIDVKSKERYILLGMHRERIEQKAQSIFLISHIPLIGQWFSYKQNVQKSNEILVILRPQLDNTGV